MGLHVNNYRANRVIWVRSNGLDITEDGLLMGRLVYRFTIMAKCAFHGFDTDAQKRSIHCHHHIAISERTDVHDRLEHHVTEGDSRQFLILNN